MPPAKAPKASHNPKGAVRIPPPRTHERPGYPCLFVRSGPGRTAGDGHQRGVKHNVASNRRFPSRPPTDDYWSPAARREGDVAAGDSLRALERSAQLAAADRLAQHHPHLELGEGGAKAAPHAAAERNPSVGLGRARPGSAPAGRRAEPGRGPRVSGQPDHRGHVGADRERVAVHLELPRAEAPARQRDHRPQAKRDSEIVAFR